MANCSQNGAPLLCATSIKGKVLATRQIGIFAQKNRDDTTQYQDLIGLLIRQKQELLTTPCRGSGDGGLTANIGRRDRSPSLDRRGGRTLR
jgi:hypothetical protein